MSTSTVGGRRLLCCGIVAGPLFLGLVLAQAATRVGFDPARHPLSLLSLGPGDWVQTTNFVIAGLLTVAGAAGLRSRLRGRPGGRWGPRLVACQGVALVWAGVFAADPGDGFPPGAAAPDTPSVHGLLHAAAPTVGGIALDVACLVLARSFYREGRAGWAVYCLVTGTADVGAAVAAGATGDFRWLLAGGAVTWLWVSVLEAHVLRGGAGPGGLSPAAGLGHAGGVEDGAAGPTFGVQRPTGASLPRRER